MEELEVLDENIVENQETTQEANDLVATVSGSDVLRDAPALTVEDITVAVEAAELQAVVTVSSGDTLFTKPLDQYTPTEGMLLILVLCAVGLCVAKIIGGILNCKFLLKK